MGSGIKILISRLVPSNKQPAVRPLIAKLRTMAMGRHGYLSGETLFSFDGSNEVLIVSSWTSVHDWEEWAASAERAVIQGQIDEILGNETRYRIYYTESFTSQKVMPAG